jgi:MFS family permease
MARLLILNQLGISVGFYMLIPFVAVHMGGLGYGAGAIGFVLGLRTLAQQTMFLPSRAAVDRLGVRPMIVVGCGLRVVAFAVFALSASLVGLLLATMLTGLAGAFFNPAVRTALLAEAPSGRGAEVMGRFNIAADAGALAGPVLGGLLLGVGFRTVAISAAGVFLALTLLQLVLLPRTPRPERIAPVLSTWRGIIRDGRFLRFCLTMSASFALYNQLYLAVPLEATRVTGAAAATSAVFTVATVVGITTQVPLVTWGRRRLGPMGSVVGGLAVMGAGFGLLSVAAPWMATAPPGGELFDRSTLADLLPLLAAVGIFTVGSALAQPFAMELLPAVGDPRLVGTYYGFYYFVSGVAAAALSWATGTVMDLVGEARWITWLMLAGVGLGAAVGAELLRRAGFGRAIEIRQEAS